MWEAFAQQLSVRPSFSVSLEGLNRFTNNKSSVIYVPVDGELAELKATHSAVMLVGFRAEKEEWIPHVGLGSVPKDR